MKNTVIKELADARDALREKIRTLKEDVEESKIRLEKGYAPILEPLKDIASKLETGRSIIAPKVEHIEKDKSYKRSPAELFGGSEKSKKVVRKLFTSTPQISPIGKDYQAKSPIAKQSPKFLSDEEIFEGFAKEGEEVEPSKTPDEKEQEEFEEEDSSFSLREYEQHARDLLQEQRDILSERLMDPNVQQAIAQFHTLPRTYLSELMTDVDRKFDTKYGVYQTEDGLYVGNNPVTFEENDIIIGDFRYPGTTGLYELLFKKKPEKFNQKDVREYRHILETTNSYRVGYDPERAKAASGAHKYINIIKPILAREKPKVYWARHWRGAGLQKQFVPGNIKEYKYWDNANELVDRLRLLQASEAAGHTGHRNEIISIIEELREGGIIL